MGKSEKKKKNSNGLSFAKAFIKGDIFTKLSAPIFGLGCFVRGQIARGVMLLGFEALFIWYMINYGIYWVSMLPSLGLEGPAKEYDSFYDQYVTVYHDNSFKILLYGVLTLFLILAVVYTLMTSVKMSYTAEMKKKNGQKVDKFKDDLKSLVDEKFYKTLLSLPCLGIFLFSFLPIVFMILVAFTNYDGAHDGYITGLFHWVGFDNFKTLFSSNGGTGSYFKIFMSILGWTIVWAILATFTNYILGILVAMMINKKGIRFKKLWRTILVMTIAIPQFISLMYVSKMFDKTGIINGLLMTNGFTKSQTVYYVDVDTHTGISVSPEKGKKLELTAESLTSVLNGETPNLTAKENEKLKAKYTLKENKTLDSYLKGNELEAFVKEYGLKDGGVLISEKVYRPLTQAPIDFWGTPLYARILVVVINIWIGIPYMMLIATGILMNIPADLYESARIDGANPFQQFRYITMPYMLFVTAPYLLTSFTGNMNNFGVIYFLTGGGPGNSKATAVGGGVGHTDLLITWLFKLTQGTEASYYMASVIGIVIFVIVSTITLIVYNGLGSNKNEGDFA